MESWGLSSPWNQASFLINHGWEGSASVCCIAIDFTRLLRDRELPLPPPSVPFCSFIGVPLHWPQRLILSRWRWFCLPSPISCPLPLVHRSQGPGWWVGGAGLSGRCVCVRGHLHWSRLLGAGKDTWGLWSHIHGPRASWVKGKSSSQLGCRCAGLSGGCKKGYVSE